jgi:hypothetical protein
MRMLRYLLIFLLPSLPFAALAELQNGDMPAARWYAHVDFVQMRSGEAGKQLYAWLEKEVFADLQEEIGFDVDKEADTITALSMPNGGIAVVVDGKFTQKTRDRIVAIGAAASDFNALEYSDTTYYFIGDDDDPGDSNHDNDSFDDGAYISVALDTKLIITSTKEQMHELINSKGRLQVDSAASGALIVLSATQALVQAGMSADSIGEDLGWDSNLLSNTRQVALLISDEGDKLSITAQLLASEEQVARSLASIVRGLISLQVFNDDLDSEFAELLQSTRVDVDGTTLTVKLAVNADSIIDIID